MCGVLANVGLDLCQQYLAFAVRQLDQPRETSTLERLILGREPATLAQVSRQDLLLDYAAGARQSVGQAMPRNDRPALRHRLRCGVVRRGPVMRVCQMKPVETVR